MSPSLTRLCLLNLLLACTLLQAQDAEDKSVSPESIKVPEPPTWITDFPIDPLDIPESAKEAGNEYFHLIERQYDLETKTKYYRYIKRFNNTGALQDGSQLEVSFDPAYQTLQFHSLIVHRNGKAIDRLPDQEFKLIQREEDHERQLYDSRLSALAVIEDTRSKDILEYSFSIQGGNPVFDPDRFYWSFETAYSVPVGNIRAYLRVPDNVTTNTTSHITDYKAVEGSKDGYKTKTWKIDEPPLLVSDGGLPGDHEPWGWIEASSYLSWGDVADWALGRYEIPETLPEELEKEVARIRKLESKEQQVLAALRFVQDEIRYLGIFEGVHSHKPYPIETILRRRFGDCKDKSLMLTSMLRKLGFDANPALVETDYRDAISNWLPSPGAFDHLVVHLSFEEESYWLDATREYQRGKLKNLYFPDYGKALLIREGESELTEIGTQGHAYSKTFVEEQYKLEDYKGEAILDVKTTYTGRDADSTRSYFASTPKAKVTKYYLNYYSDLYENIEATADIEYEDDEATNTLTVTESYRIPDIWIPREGNDQYLDANFYSQYTYDELESPSTKKRTMPYAISHPVNTEHYVEITMPTPLEEEAREETIRDPAFSFDYTETYEGTKTLLSFTYKSEADRVQPENTSDYLANVDKAENLTTYSMWITRDLHEGRETVEEEEPYYFNWAVAAVIFLSLLVSVLTCLLLLRWVPKPKSGRLDPTLDGLGGWLILPAIGLCITPFVSLFNTATSFYDFDLAQWYLFTDPGGEFYHTLWAPNFLIEFAVIAFYFPFSIFLLTRFFQKHSSFPLLYISLLGFDALISGLLWGMAEIATDDPEMTSEYATAFAGSFVGGIVWISYTLVSVRVATTFRTGPPEIAITRQPPALPPRQPEINL